MNIEPEPLRIRCRNCRTHLDASGMEPFSLVPCPVCGTTLRIPRRFGRYLLEKLCGRGSFTTTYRAIDPRLARRVAVKVLDHADKEDASELGSRFFTEAKLVAGLNHPSILPVYDCGVCEALPFLVTRYMPGGDLEKLAETGQLPGMARVLEIVYAVAEGLQYAFQTANVVHHAVKMSNILLADDEVRLGDFDLADVRQYGDLATPCAVWATPAGASPERLLNGGEDCRGDIFSLGVVLYELLGKCEPFGESGTAEELYEARREMAFPALCELAPGVPEELSDLVTRMLDFLPERRPGYAELLRQLKAVIDGMRRGQ